MFTPHPPNFVAEGERRILTWIFSFESFRGLLGNSWWLNRSGWPKID